MNPLTKMLNMFYNQRECSEQMVIGQTTLSGWVKKGFIPYKNADYIEQQSMGKIKADDVRKYANKIRKSRKTD